MELATIRAGENCNKHNIAATIRTAVDEALRAALAPPQAAPAQEPVAWAWFHRGQVNFDGSDALRELDDLKATPIPLYAAPQPAQADEALTCSDAREERVGCYRAVRAENRADEAVALLREVVRRYDDYRGKGVMPAPGEYQMVVGVIERIRAFLKDRT